MGARFLVVALIGSAAWYGSRWHASPLPWGSIVWRVLAVSFCAATLGKIVGIVAFRFKQHSIRARED